jgi:hypothetical protein
MYGFAGHGVYPREMDLANALGEMFRRELHAQMAPLQSAVRRMEEGLEALELLRSATSRLVPLTSRLGSLAGMRSSSPVIPAPAAVRRGRPPGRGAAAKVAVTRAREDAGARACAVIDCERPSRSKGYCSAHYQKLRLLMRTNRRPAAWVDDAAPQSVEEVKLPRGRAASKALQEAAPRATARLARSGAKAPAARVARSSAPVAASSEPPASAPRTARSEPVVPAPRTARGASGPRATRSGPRASASRAGRSETPAARAAGSRGKASASRASQSEPVVPAPRAARKASGPRATRSGAKAPAARTVRSKAKTPAPRGARSGPKASAGKKGAKRGARSRR